MAERGRIHAKYGVDIAGRVGRKGGRRTRFGYFQRDHEACVRAYRLTLWNIGDVCLEFFDVNNREEVVNQKLRSLDLRYSRDKIAFELAKHFASNQFSPAPMSFIFSLKLVVSLDNNWSQTKILQNLEIYEISLRLGSIRVYWQPTRSTIY